MAEYEVKCVQCGLSFVAHRSDNKFCSHACIMRDQRRKQKEKLIALENLIERLPGQQPHIINDLFA